MYDDLISQLPESLMSREGWSDLLDDQRRSEPHLHQIEPTNHCPYTCRMCPRTTMMTRPLGFMDLDLYHKVMTDCPGHPFLSPSPRGVPVYQHLGSHPDQGADACSGPVGLFLFAGIISSYRNAASDGPGEAKPAYFLSSVV